MLILFNLLIKLNILLVRLINCIGVREEINDQVMDVNLLLKKVIVINVIIYNGLLV